MAVLYHRTTSEVVDKDIEVRALEDDEHDLAVSFHIDDIDDTAVVEVLFTKAEVSDMYDLLFNK